MLNNEQMSTVEENRRQRLILLEKEFGTQVALAEKIGKSPAQISQWKNASKYSGSEKRRAMDRSTARHIEKMTGKPEGWLDQPIQTPFEPPNYEVVNSPAGDVAPEPQAQNECYITFDLLNVEAAAGTGLVAPENPEVLQRVNVLESWARTALGGDLSRIKLISARGTSMQGTIENGDVLFVDATVRAYDGDGIYVIARGGDVQVKRLQKLHGDVLAIISDNRAYESERLMGDDANAVVVCGRVLAAWSLRKFW